MIAGRPVRRSIEGFQAMNDTVKIERPMCCRRRDDRGGRIKQDSLGNAICVRTRAHDSQDDDAGWLLEPAANPERDSPG
jgi:hypothetical protein